MLDASWLSFLTRHQAVLNLDNIEHCGNAAQELALVTQETALFSVLSHYAALHVTGKDAASYLQGQFSCDVHQVTTSQGQLAVYCNPQGRVICVCYVVSAPDGFLVFLPQSMLDAVLARLRKYVVFAKVAITDVSSSYVLFASKAPVMDDRGMGQAESFKIIVSAEKGLVLYGCHVGNAPELWENLIKHCQVVGCKAWDIARMRSGLVEITPANSEQFLPHNLNLVILGAVNFNKGCYTGQEIIARMQFRGTVKKHLYGITIASEQLPVVGSDIFIEGQETPVGAVVECQVTSANSYFGLAILKDEVIGAEDIKLVLADAYALFEVLLK